MIDLKWDFGRLNSGELSALRRSAGLPVGKAEMTALRAFYRACGYCDAKQEPYWFPAVCMDALWRETDHPTVKAMEICLRELIAQDEKATESMQHRIDMLLETRWDEDGFLLGKIMNQVKLLKSRTELKPDFQALAEDLRCWNYRNHPVQRRWLRVLYNVNSSKSNEEGTENVD